MQLDSLSWFPGHMTKTRRMITAATWTPCAKFWTRASR